MSFWHRCSPGNSLLFWVSYTSCLQRLMASVYSHENSPAQAYEADQIVPNIHVPCSRHLEMMQILESVMACPTANNMVHATNNRPEVHATQPTNSQWNTIHSSLHNRVLLRNK